MCNAGAVRKKPQMLAVELNGSLGLDANAAYAVFIFSLN